MAKSAQWRANGPHRGDRVAHRYARDNFVKLGKTGIGIPEIFCGHDVDATMIVKDQINVIKSRWPSVCREDNFSIRRPSSTRPKRLPVLSNDAATCGLTARWVAGNPL